MNWCGYTEDDYGEGLPPPTNVALVEVILITGKYALQQKKPSFQKNLEKIMIYGDESDDNEKFLVMKDDESEESLPRPLENSKMVMI